MELSIVSIILSLIGGSLGMLPIILSHLQKEKSKLDKYDETAKGSSYTPVKRKQMNLESDQRYELDKANQLYKCMCGKYSRLYQQELKWKDLELKGEKVKPSEYLKRIENLDNVRKRNFYSLDARVNSGKVCPHCSADKPDVRKSDDDWPWLNTHPDCPKIDYEGYLQYRNTLKEVEQLIYDMKSMEAYQKYNGFELMGEKKTVEKRATLYLDGHWMRNFKEGWFISHKEGQTMLNDRPFEYQIGSVDLIDREQGEYKYGVKSGRWMIIVTSDEEIKSFNRFLEREVK